MRVVRADEFVAVCRDDDRDLHEVAIDLVAPVEVGDEVLVHAGVAISHLGATA
jgi:hydrogenase maturation factor